MRVPSTVIVCGFLLLHPLAHADGAQQPSASPTSLTVECPLQVLTLLKEGHGFSHAQAQAAWAELSPDAKARAEAFIIRLAATVERDTLTAHKAWMESGNRTTDARNLPYVRWLKKAERNREINSLAYCLEIPIGPWARKCVR